MLVMLRMYIMLRVQALFFLCAHVGTVVKIRSMGLASVLWLTYRLVWVYAYECGVVHECVFLCVDVHMHMTVCVLLCKPRC